MSNGNGAHTARSAVELAQDLDPEDGFHVADFGTGGAYELALVFREKGVLANLPGTTTNYHTMLTVSDPDARDAGRVRRTYHMLRALCRYINTGGSTDDLRALCETMCLAMGRVSLDLDGFFLLASDINTEGVFEHVFAREDSSDCIRVVEDRFVDLVTLEEMENES